MVHNKIKARIKQSGFFLLLIQACILAQGFEKVWVKEVVDGETFILKNNRVVRMLNINAPPIDRKNPANSTREGILSKDWLMKWVIQGSFVYLEFEGNKFDRHGRVLAYAWIKNKNLNVASVAAGVSRFSPKPRVRKKYLKQFTQAEAEAKQYRRGFWKTGKWVVKRMSTIKKRDKNKG